MYSSGRSFVWPPSSEEHASAQQHQQQHAPLAAHAPEHASPQARPLAPAPYGLSARSQVSQIPPPPAPGSYNSPYNPHANAFGAQPYTTDPNLEAVRAYVQGPSASAQQSNGASAGDSPSQQLIAAANQANELQDQADDDEQDGDEGDEPMGDPGAPAPTDDADNPMPPPPAGSIWLTRDALLKGCNDHARKYGYAMSIKKSSASGSKTIIVCTREGKPMNNHHLSDATRVRRGRVSKRSGCRMKIAGNKIRRVNADGVEEEVWRLRIIEGQHNHGPDEVRLNPIHRKMTEDVKEAIVRGLRRGLKIKRIYEELLAQWPDLPATKQDVRNEVGRIRKAEVDLTPLEEDAEAIAVEAERRRVAQAAARAAGVTVTEADKTTIAILRVEKSQLEDELKRVREGNQGIATAATRDENDELKRQNKKLEKEIEQLKRDAIKSEVRIDELRGTVDRYMMQAMAPGGSQQETPQPPPQPQGHGLSRTYSGQMGGQAQYGGQYQQPPQQQTPSSRRAAGSRVASHGVGW